jgi:hypothetical protein
MSQILIIISGSKATYLTVSFKNIGHREVKKHFHGPPQVFWDNTVKLLLRLYLD